MGYFEDEQTVEDYIRMAEGYDGRQLLPVLHQYVADGASLLELGMGPGKDLDLFAAHYSVTGSDSSPVFVERYRRGHPTADQMLLDAETMETTRTFDCIFSNKVLMHLTRDALERSLHRQAAVLNREGVLFHTFWCGEETEEHAGLLFVQYTEKTFLAAMGPEFELLESGRYAEMEPGDSIYFVLRKATS